MLHKRARKVGRSRRLPAIASFVRRMVCETLPPVAEMHHWPACTPCALLALALGHAPPTCSHLDRAVVETLDLSMLDEARLRRVAELLRSMRAGGAPLVNMLQRTFPAAAALTAAPSAVDYGKSSSRGGPGRGGAAVVRSGRRRARRLELEEEDDEEDEHEEEEEEEYEDRGDEEEEEEEVEDAGGHREGPFLWPRRKHAATASSVARRAPGPENATTAVVGEAWKGEAALGPAGRPRLRGAPL